MIRFFAGKISFTKYNDRHLQNTIYWFLRLNQYCNLDLEDNILHNFQFQHDTDFILDFANFGKAKKTNQLKQTDKEKEESNSTKEFVSSLQSDLKRSKNELEKSKYEHTIIKTLIHRFKICHDESNINQFLTYDEILHFLSRTDLYMEKFDYLTLFKNYKLLFSVDNSILNSPKLFSKPSLMTYFTLLNYTSAEDKLKKIPDCREQILSFHDQSTDVETYKFTGMEYNIPYIINIFFDADSDYETSKFVYDLTAITLAEILKSSDGEPVKFVPYFVKKKLTPYP